MIWILVIIVLVLVQIAGNQEKQAIQQKQDTFWNSKEGQEIWKDYQEQADRERGSL